MSRFAALDRLANRSLDRLMAEPLRIEPRTGGEFTGNTLDTSRSVFEVWGVVDTTPVISGSHETSRGAHTAQLSGHVIEVSIQSALMPYEPKPGDRIVSIKRGERYAIKVVKPDGVGRTVFACAPAGKVDG